jgi:dihydrofolate reductase
VGRPDLLIGDDAIDLLTEPEWVATQYHSINTRLFTLDRAEWNNSTIITGNVSEEVAKLKQEPGQNLLIFGSSAPVNSLLRQHLLDELRLLVYPVVLGCGRRLFQEGPPVGLTVAEATVFGSGVVLLTYHPAATKN